MQRTEMASPPSRPATTTARFEVAPPPRIPTRGRLKIAVAIKMSELASIRDSSRAASHHVGTQRPGPRRASPDRVRRVANPTTVNSCARRMTPTIRPSLPTRALRVRAPPLRAQHLRVPDRLRTSRLCNRALRLAGDRQPVERRRGDRFGTDAAEHLVRVRFDHTFQRSRSTAVASLRRPSSPGRRFAIGHDGNADTPSRGLLVDSAKIAEASKCVKAG
jgi:hypothetical protein